MINIVYKSVGSCIVELMLLNDTVTNMNRINIVDKRYAKYRCDKVKVLKIYDKITCVNHQYVCDNHDKMFKYVKNEIIELDNIDKIFVKGISFYLTKKVAFFHTTVSKRQKSHSTEISNAMR